MKYIFFTLSFFLAINLSAKTTLSLDSHVSEVQFGGLKRILKDRYIRILTTRNAFDFYVYQGKSKGLQYEMAKSFNKFLNKKFSKNSKTLPIQFELIPVKYDQLIPSLLSGKGDIIAAGLTHTPERNKKVAFAKPYQKVDEVIVTHKKNTAKSWFKKSFAVRKSSSYFESLKNYNKAKPKAEQVYLEKASEDLHFDNLLELISLGKYQYTVVDTNLADIAVKAYPNLVILKDRPFGKQQKIGWAIRKEDKKLLELINKFIPKVRKGSLLGNILTRKYYSDLNTTLEQAIKKGKKQISPYDSLIKKYSKKYDLDWRLVTALCFQESRFNQKIVNKWGAIGLFQVKQMTANEPYVNIREITGIKNTENNIHAGVKYLSWIKKRYFDPIEEMDENEKLRMAMASYNAGPATVRRARNLAKKMKLNPNEWFRNVELALLKMRKHEHINLELDSVLKRLIYSFSFN